MYRHGQHVQQQQAGGLGAGVANPPEPAEALRGNEGQAQCSCQAHCQALG
eukprot:CAMPEP_0202915750 /NCGR_PEP_ID=MMETSP1392-20130828/66576_1 /ASSEMBLY_ACC=CAM_ASM_000868 /TAXON_ID=225041 /ORGANISM="Chlamydomonas chlamydogama, Strain SAG 11-48b" /LENGTH=49 /DNA_ID= /DNA_START= /DNA_END= /DNA_ORIENTATION=